MADWMIILSNLFSAEDDRSTLLELLASSNTRIQELCLSSLPDPLKKGALQKILSGLESRVEKLTQENNVLKKSKTRTPTVARNHKIAVFNRDNGCCVVSGVHVWSVDLYLNGKSRISTPLWDRSVAEFPEAKLNPSNNMINSHVVPFHAFDPTKELYSHELMKPVLSVIDDGLDVKTCITLAKPYDFVFNTFMFSVNPNDSKTLVILCPSLQTAIQNGQVVFPPEILTPEDKSAWPPSQCWTFHYNYGLKYHTKCPKGKSGCFERTKKFILLLAGVEVEE